MGKVFIMIIMIITLPSNLRPTTRECMHLVMGHFRSRDNKEFRASLLPWP